MRINLLNSAQDENPKPYDVTWEELCEALTTPGPACAKDDAPAWVPAHFEGQRRGTVNARSVCALVLDCDDFTVQRWHETIARLDELGLSYAWHTTSSHTPIDGKLRYRVAVKLSRPVEAVRWKAFYKVAAPELTGATDRIEIKKIVQTCDPGRIYYQPVEGPHFACGISQGTEALDVELVLETAEAHAPASSLHEGQTHEATRRGLDVLSTRTLKSEWDRSAQATLFTLLNPKPGEDYASHGGRDDALWAVARFIARHMPMVEGPTVTPFLIPGLANASPKEGEPACRHADGKTFSDKLERALDEELARFKEGDPDQIAKAGRSTVYNEQEISQFVADQGVPNLDQLTKQLIIQHRSNLYVFSQGDYIYAGTRDNAELLVMQELQPCLGMKVDLQKLTPNGVVEKEWKEIFKSHALAVRNIIPDLSVKTSFVDPNTKTLVHAVCPRRPDLTPVHDPAIEQWLSTWGDETLLDWLATAPKLEKATAALYLRGVPNSGKTMLAQGLAAIWGRSPTEMDSLKENFNDELTQNPVVFADETISKRFRDDSGLLRRLITATHVTLNRKYMETAKLQGSVRVIIAKNHLGLFGPKESMTRDDVDAIAERILYYHLPHIAPYFHPLRLAQHILWLEETRGPNLVQQSTARLWVRGRDSELHRHMRISSRDRSLVCQWVMEMLCNPAPAKNLQATLLLLRDGVTISPRCIYNHWDLYLGNEARLSMPQVASVLQEIGLKDARGRYTVNVEDLKQWADIHSYPTEVELLIEQAAERVQKAAN